MKTILIVEDEKDILTSLRDFLLTENYNVLTAENGLVALNILKDAGAPNLILLDMKMPVMDGWTFAAEFEKAYDKTSPIVVLTAAANAKERASDINASGWIEKPFDLDVLLEKIKKYERPEVAN